MKYKIDVVRIRENSITLNGWVLGKSPESRATFRVEDEKHKPVKFKAVSTRRDDVSQIYFKKVYDRDFGFDIRFPYERGKTYWLLIRCEGRQAKIKFNEELIAKRASVAHKRMEKIRDLMNMETVRVAVDFWKEHGLRALVVKSRHKLAGLDNDYDYSEWYDLTKPTQEELAAQREAKFAFRPLLSVVIPAYKTPERYLREMLDSILEQTYDNWEVCLADGSPKGQSLERILKKYAQKDPRIRYQILGENLGIAGNTNAALQMASGDFVILADHDDTIPPHAFYEVAKTVNEHPDCQVIYSDEDKLDMDGRALLIRILSRTLIRIFSPASTISAIFLWCGGIFWNRSGASARNLTEPRIMILFSGAQRRPGRSAISPRCCTTGAAIRDPHPATRRAKCMRLRRAQGRSWRIMSGWASRRRRWRRAWIMESTAPGLRSRGNR